MLMVACSCDDRHSASSGDSPYSAGPFTGVRLLLSKHAAAVAVQTAHPDNTDPLVSRFLDAVWMERGLSTNTLAAYRADLTALARWLAESKVQMVNTTRSHLQDF